MSHITNPKDSETDAYTYIIEELGKLGWIVKNPARVPEGEVYKKNEALANKELKEGLVREMPENIIKLNEIEFWVIEAKRSKKEIEKALGEARDYAKKINQCKKIKCLIASGVAGNDTDGFTVINQFLRSGKWETILFNGKTKDTLLSKQQAQYIIKNKEINYKEFPDFPEEKYEKSARKINEIMHNSGINKKNRARFITGLILSLSLDEEINLNTTKTDLLIDNINSLIKRKLREVKKDNFYAFINLTPPPTEENHIKYRQAIINTLKELQTLDIKNAMSSGTDILGKFYGNFLKYGNDAKEIGIVLTPRHITEFGVDVLNVRYGDYVLDPCCGTGGFLVSAFDFVKKTANIKQINKFKNHNLFGIEKDDEVVVLALVNMIFRGDGWNNMNEGDCFQKNIVKIKIEDEETGKFDKREGKENPKPIITKVLMNPPFALKQGSEKEYKFIDYALSQMEDNNLLFAILPSPIMFKGKKVKEWRKEMLAKNTLKAVIKFPEDLFYPIGVHTSGVIIEKGTPHDYKRNVFWGRLEDGYIKKKGVMKKKSDGNIEDIKSLVKDFLNGSITLKKSVPKQYSIEPILVSQEDTDLECAPEYYLKEIKHSDEEVVMGMREAHLNLVNYLINNPFFKSVDINLDQDCKIESSQKLNDLFTIENAKSQNIEDYGLGEMPFITSTNTNNGIEKYIDEDEEGLIYRKPCITLSSFGQATVQITPFVARSHGAVLVLVPEYVLFEVKAPSDFDKWDGKITDIGGKYKIDVPQDKITDLKDRKKVFVGEFRLEKSGQKLKVYAPRDMSLRQLLYYTAQINLHRWRFSYGRWLTKKRLLKLEIPNITTAKLPTIQKITKPFEESLKHVQKTFLNR